MEGGDEGVEIKREGEEEEGVERKREGEEVVKIEKEEEEGGGIASERRRP